MIPNYLHKPSGYKTRNPMFWWYWYNTLRKNCVLYLPMVYNNAAHTQVKDWSGNGNHGTITGATKVTAPWNQAFYFDGEDDVINCGNATSLDCTKTKIFSLSCWLKTDTLVGTGHVVERFDATDGKYFAFQRYTNKLRLYAKYSGGAADVRSDDAVEVDKWYYIVYSLDGSIVKMYLNGVLQDDTHDISGIGTPVATTAMLGIGGDYADFEGYINEVMVFNIGLTSAQQLKIYNWTKSAYGH